MTSSALLTSVAESTVIFLPIVQVGCLSASATVARDTRSRPQVRNGPPEAVRIRRASSVGRRPATHCSTALCSESTGTISPPPSRAAREGGGEIVPVDSEHSAVLQCVAGRRPTELARLILTASGGPFRTWGRERVSRATVAEALKHPTWTMGKKITVDSATLVNKALEVIEAHFLFDVDYDHVDMVIHPQSVIHGFAEFVDGSVLAQIGFPTMELPILYALTYPERVPDQGVRRFDPVAVGTLTFEAVQPDRFPAYAVGRDAARLGGTAPARFNAANEVAVQLFLEERITFGRIAEIIERVVGQARPGDATSLEDVLAADADARRLAQEAACS